MKEDIEEISNAAEKEARIEAKLAEIQEQWSEMAFTFADFKHKVYFYYFISNIFRLLKIIIGQPHLEGYRNRGNFRSLGRISNSFECHAE